MMSFARSVMTSFARSAMTPHGCWLCCSICGIDQPRHVGHAHTFVAMHAMLRSATAIASTAPMSFPETAERVRRLPPTGQDRRDVLS
jgi:hypothetical protein